MESDSEAETVEFEIDVVQSQSSASLASVSIDDLNQASTADSNSSSQTGEKLQDQGPFSTEKDNQIRIDLEAQKNESILEDDCIHRTEDGIVFLELKNNSKDAEIEHQEQIEIFLEDRDQNPELEQSSTGNHQIDVLISEASDEVYRHEPDSNCSQVPHIEECVPAEHSIIDQLSIGENFSSQDPTTIEYIQDLDDSIIVRQIQNINLKDDVNEPIKLDLDDTKAAIEETEVAINEDDLNHMVDLLIDETREEILDISTTETKTSTCIPINDELVDIKNDQPIESLVAKECIEPPESPIEIKLEISQLNETSINTTLDPAIEQDNSTEPLLENLLETEIQKNQAISVSPEIEIELVDPISADDDLEKELDEEPEFIKRDVKIKKNLDPKKEYSLGDELGRGKFGTVYRCQEESTGRNLAAKFVHIRRKEDREDVEREVEIMCKLQHKRLLQLYDAFDNGKELCLISELVEGGELFERIVNEDFELTEKKAATFMRQICEGVEYMHSQNIVHLDMKPENILCVSKTGNLIKLIDFGLARQLDDNQPLRVMFGTPDFAAPEVLGYDVVSLATDMWSVGVICYVLLSGLSPFMGDNDIETMANVSRANYDFDDGSFDPISDLAKDFISKLLIKSPNERLKPNECLEHPWLQKGGMKLEESVRERRKSSAILSLNASDQNRLDAMIAIGEESDSSHVSTASDLESNLGVISLDKTNLRKYVFRRKWHKTVHAITALSRMGAKLKLLMTNKGT